MTWRALGGAPRDARGRKARIRVEMGCGMSVAFTTDPQKIHDLSLPEGTDVAELKEMAEFADSLAAEVEEEWEEFPPRIQDAVTELAFRDDLEQVIDAWRRIRGYLSQAEEKKALDDFFNAVIRLRESTLDAIERDKSRGAFREYTDEQIEKWEEADKLPPDLAEWVKGTLRQ